MKNNSKKATIVGIVGAVVAILLLAGLITLVLTQCGTPGNTATTAEPTESTASPVLDYNLYWNLDRALYAGQSEGGMSSRVMEADGSFLIRFLLDGEEVTLKTLDRKLVNAIDSQDLMGLELDSDGYIIKVLSPDNMPLQKVGWGFYVQSASTGGKVIKVNSSETYGGMEVVLENHGNALIMDMTGSGKILQNGAYYRKLGTMPNRPSRNKAV